MFSKTECGKKFELCSSQYLIWRENSTLL